MAPVLTPALAAKLAGLALAGVEREWPHVFVHVVHGPGEIVRPRQLHPAFYGGYDWHSAVHGHWTLVRLLHLFPDLPLAPQIRAALDRNLTAEKLATELAYFQAPDRGSFERPYGWGWLLALAAETRATRDPSSRRWAAAIRPLEKFISRSFQTYLPRLPYPIRTGVHNNTAFALCLALDYARAAADRRLEKAIVGRSRDFYGSDADAPGAYEPSGDDFLSPALTESDLMSRVLSPAEYRRWLGRFLPGLAQGRPRALLHPPVVFDRRDGKQVHLDGLCLSRAWGLARIAAVRPESRALRAAAQRHAEAGLERVASGDYAGEHWLASFAVYLLQDPPPAT